MALRIERIPTLSRQLHLSAALRGDAARPPSWTRPRPSRCEARRRARRARHEGALDPPPPRPLDGEPGAREALRRAGLRARVGRAAACPASPTPLEEGDTRLGRAPRRRASLFIPAHTRGHIAYVFDAARAVFCGDTLFAAGCGRLFEGTPEMMFERAAEARRAARRHARLLRPRVHREQPALRGARRARQRRREARASSASPRSARSAAADWHDATPDEMTVPSTIADEHRTNPFMRARRRRRARRAPRGQGPVLARAPRAGARHAPAGARDLGGRAPRARSTRPTRWASSTTRTTCGTWSSRASSGSTSTTARTATTSPRASTSRRRASRSTTAARRSTTTRSRSRPGSSGCAARRSRMAYEIRRGAVLVTGATEHAVIDLEGRLRRIPQERREELCASSRSARTRRFESVWRAPQPGRSHQSRARIRPRRAGRAAAPTTPTRAGWRRARRPGPASGERTTSGCTWFSDARDGGGHEQQIVDRAERAEQEDRHRSIGERT